MYCFAQHQTQTPDTALIAGKTGGRWRFLRDIKWHVPHWCPCPQDGQGNNINDWNLHISILERRWKLQWHRHGTTHWSVLRPNHGEEFNVEKFGVRWNLAWRWSNQHRAQGTAGHIRPFTRLYTQPPITSAPHVVEFLGGFNAAPFFGKQFIGSAGRRSREVNVRFGSKADIRCPPNTRREIGSWRPFPMRLRVGGLRESDQGGPRAVQKATYRPRTRYVRLGRSRGHRSILTIWRPIRWPSLSASSEV